MSFSDCLVACCGIKGEAFLVEELFDCFVDELYPCVGVDASSLVVLRGGTIVVGFK